MGGYSLVLVHRVLTVVASLHVEHRINRCGIFPDQELDLFLALAGGFFLPQSQKGSPNCCFFTVPGLNRGHHTASLHLAVKSPESPQICLSWFSMILTLWKSPGQVFARMSFYLDCVVFFSWSDRGYGFGGRTEWHVLITVQQNNWDWGFISSS